MLTRERGTYGHDNGDQFLDIALETGEGEAQQVVPGGVREGETADHPRYHGHHPVETGEDVQCNRIQGHEDRVQAVRVFVLHHEHRQRGQRAHHARAHPAIRGDHGQGVRECMRARHRLQLPAGILHSRRACHRREHPGVLLHRDPAQAQDL